MKERFCLEEKTYKNKTVGCMDTFTNPILTKENERVEKQHSYFCDTFIYVPEYHNSWMVKAETVGQYTGLTDKNGTRIFEGDIVKYKIIGLNAFGKMEKRETKSIVKYNAPCFSPFETDLYEDYVMPDEAEVIGNIHDNPELLKGEQTWQQSK